MDPTTETLYIIAISVTACMDYKFVSFTDLPAYIRS